MSKRVSKAASLELTFLAALDSVHADVDTSEIARNTGLVQSSQRKILWRLRLRTPSDLSKPRQFPSALRPRMPQMRLILLSGGVSGVILGASSNVASHGSVQYSQMAIPQLIAACTSESSEEAWNEFIRRFQPVILMA